MRRTALCLRSYDGTAPGGSVSNVDTTVLQRMRDWHRPLMP